MSEHVCPACSQRLRIDPAWAGRPVKCPSCGQVSLAPAAPRGTNQTGPFATRPPEADEELSLTAEREIIRVCDRFEKAWKGALPGGAGPEIESYLEGTEGAKRNELRKELLRLDAEYRGKSPRAGRYRLQERLDHGGMGEVFRAHDPDLDRALAVKVLLERFRNDSGLQDRFLEEARVTGRLQHPGVVPVHEVGRLDDGRPFFAMKLVLGQTLDDLLTGRASVHEESGRFVGIFAQVCQALAFAHSLGIIHRDLKPSNVMVGAFGEVQVMDWGLAKVLRAPPPSPQGAGGTELGAILGTPAYMAPEQARGEVGLIDERSDVFGLGAILCEILTGKPPFAGDHALRLAQQADLADAFARLAACGADTELIALAKRCLAPEREGRPSSAEEVAKSVARHQATVQERLREEERKRERAEILAHEERKRRLLAIGLAAAVLFLMAGAAAAGLWYQNHRANRAARIARLETEAALALEQAGARRQEALRLTDDVRRWPVLLTDALAGVKRAEDLLAQEDQAGSELVGQARALRDGLEADRRDWKLAADFEQVHRDRAELDSAQGKYKTELVFPRLRQALEEYGLSIGGSSVSEAVEMIQKRPWHAQQKVVSTLDLCLGHAPAPENQARKWLRAVLSAIDKDPWRERVRTAMVENDRARLIKLAREVDASRQQPAFLVLVAGVLPGNALESEIALLRLARRHHPSDFWVNHNLAFALRNSVVAGQMERSPTAEERARIEESVRYYTAALALRPDVSGAWINLSAALEALDDSEGAADAARRATELAPKSAAAHGNLGNALRSKKDLDGAIRAYRKAVELAPEHPRLHSNLGHALGEKKDFAGAIGCYRRAIALLEKNGAVLLEPFGRARLSVAYEQLGRALKNQGDLKESRKALDRAIAVAPEKANPRIALGDLLLDEGDFAGALEAYRQAIRVKPKSPTAYGALGLALLNMNELDKSVLTLRKAIKLDPGAAYLHAALGRALALQGHFDEARAAVSRCLELLRPGDPLLTTANRLIRFCDRQKAREARLPAVLSGKESPRDASDCLNLAVLCDRPRLGLYAAAARLYADAFARQPGLADDPKTNLRSSAACAAALASAGKGKDAGKLDDKERARWRKQALDWLRADLAARVRLLDKGAALAFGDLVPCP